MTGAVLYSVYGLIGYYEINAVLARSVAFEKEFDKLAGMRAGMKNMEN